MYYDPVIAEWDVTYRSPNGFIWIAGGGGVFALDPPRDCPNDFLPLPKMEGNFTPFLFGARASVEVAGSLKPGGKNLESVSMLSNREDISNLKSDLEDGLLLLIFLRGDSEFSSGLNPGGRNALMSSNFKVEITYGY